MTQASRSGRSSTPPLVVQVYLDVVRARERLDGMLLELFKHHPTCSGLTLSLPKYNVLRILRGAGDEGLPCQEIGRRMITRVPDVTRLVDRLENAGLVRRERSPQDRRVVRILPTEGALRLLARLDDPILEIHEEQFQHLETEELEQVHTLLSKLLGEGA